MFTVNRWRPGIALPIKIGLNIRSFKKVLSHTKFIPKEKQHDLYKKSLISTNTLKGKVGQTQYLIIDYKIVLYFVFGFLESYRDVTTAFEILTKKLLIKDPRITT